ncbi:hypothetical protein [Okeania sp. SIO3I5]|uniref:hypothetical protein n=1 Tax=Okeania sp. SIO3I5 TaxID=2607805 RepID=UPI0025DC0F27|nr:hypothetical protein [Okeania sp. SIO3I5]
MNSTNKENAQSKPEAIQRTEIFNVGKFDSDSSGLHTNTGCTDEPGSEPESGSRRDNTRTNGYRIEAGNNSNERDYLKKLANQLELLTGRFNQYIGSHRGRLEKRLEENQQFAQDFKEDLADLKQEIEGFLGASKTLE